MGYPPQELQWGRASGARKAITPGPTTKNNRASMGPCFGSTEGVIFMRGFSCYPCFNGAVLREHGRHVYSLSSCSQGDSLQWGRASGARKAGGTCGVDRHERHFNGAVLREHGRPTYTIVTGPNTLPLQWGRASGARKARSYGTLQTPCFTSMGPCFGSTEGGLNHRKYEQIAILQCGRTSGARKASGPIPKFIKFKQYFNGAVLREHGRRG